MKDRTITLRMKKNMYDRLKKVANKSGMTISQYLRLIVSIDLLEKFDFDGNVKEIPNLGEFYEQFRERADSMGGMNQFFEDIIDL
jgi:predicted DNA-binding protein